MVKSLSTKVTGLGKGTKKGARKYEGTEKVLTFQAAPSTD